MSKLRSSSSSSLPPFMETATSTAATSAAKPKAAATTSSGTTIISTAPPSAATLKKLSSLLRMNQWQEVVDLMKKRHMRAASRVSVSGGGGSGGGLVGRLGRRSSSATAKEIQEQAGQLAVQQLAMSLVNTRCMLGHDLPLHVALRPRLDLRTDGGILRTPITSEEASALTLLVQAYPEAVLVPWAPHYNYNPDCPPSADDDREHPEDDEASEVDVVRLVQEQDASLLQVAIDCGLAPSVLIILFRACPKLAFLPLGSSSSPDSANHAGAGSLFETYSKLPIHGIIQSTRWTHTDEHSEYRKSLLAQVAAAPPSPTVKKRTIIRGGVIGRQSSSAPPEEGPTAAPGEEVFIHRQVTQEVAFWDRLEKDAIQLIQLLLQIYPQSVHCVGDRGRGMLPLHYACDTAGIPPAVIRFLCRAHPSALRKANHAGLTPLEIFCSSSHHHAAQSTTYVEVLRELLEHQQTPSSSSSASQNNGNLSRTDPALSPASSKQSLNGAARRRRRSVDGLTMPSAPLTTAALAPSTTGTAPKGSLALHWYCLAGRASREALRLLVNHAPASATLPNSDGFFPLHLLCRKELYLPHRLDQDEEEDDSHDAILRDLVCILLNACPNVAKIRCPPRVGALPLDIAFSCGMPRSVIQDLIHAYPQGPRMEDDRGYVTCQLLLEFDVEDDVLAEVLRAFPEGLYRRMVHVSNRSLLDQFEAEADRREAAFEDGSVDARMFDDEEDIVSSGGDPERHRRRMELKQKYNIEILLQMAHPEGLDHPVKSIQGNDKSDKSSSEEGEDTEGLLAIHMACRNGASLKVLRAIHRQCPRSLRCWYQGDFAWTAADHHQHHHDTDNHSKSPRNANAAPAAPAAGATATPPNRRGSLRQHLRRRRSSSVRRRNSITQQVVTPHRSLPLHMACYRGREASLDTVQFLVRSYGAALCEVDGNGSLPFVIACLLDASPHVCYTLLREYPEVLHLIATGTLARRNS